VGLSNDSNTEVTSGLKEGDMVVTRTVSGTAPKVAAPAAGSGIRIPGITGGRGGG
jgi:hypothetical protein